MGEEGTLLVNRWGRKGYAWDNLALEGDKLIAIQETEQWQSEVEKKKTELASIKRGLIRSLVLVLDLSNNGLEARSFGQNRMKLIQDQTTVFISDFFVQNPLSQLAILGTYGSACRILSNLSSDVDAHLKVINEISSLEHKGEPSIQTSLAIATAILGSEGKGGLANIDSTKEVLFIYGSLTTCDVDPIYKTLAKVKKSQIRVSFVGLGAKVFVLERIAEETDGDYFVPVSLEHLEDIMHSFVIPPQRLKNQKSGLLPFGFAAISETKIPAFDLFKFLENAPSEDNLPDLPKYGGYQCPRCKTRVFSVPCYCPVCRDFLIAPAYLKRTAIHLSPLPPFSTEEPTEGLCCIGCNKALTEPPRVCPLCNKCFCEKCDKFVHEILQSCPGCMALKLSK